MTNFQKWYDEEFKTSLAYPIVISSCTNTSEETIRGLARLFWEMGYERGFEACARKHSKLLDSKE